jgi:hypothetical protein
MSILQDGSTPGCRLAKRIQLASLIQFSAGFLTDCISLKQNFTVTGLLVG